MAISKVVAVAACAIESRGPADVRAMLAVVARMPEYVERKRLVLWEAEVNAVMPPDFHLHEDPIGRLAGEIFELGMENMYGAVDVDLTARLYGELVAHAANIGIALPTVVDLRDW
jgi:hypothetical protein